MSSECPDTNTECTGCHSGPPTCQLQMGSTTPQPHTELGEDYSQEQCTRLSLGIIITGGSGDYYYGTGVSVEVLRANGSSWCSLPDMPQDRQEHTQSGLVACGGFDHSSRASCVTFANGSWNQSHHLQEERADHTSWRSPSGLVLMGGQFSSYNTELLSDITGDSAEHFPLRYETK